MIDFFINLIIAPVGYLGVFVYSVIKSWIKALSTIWGFTTLIALCIAMALSQNVIMLVIFGLLLTVSWLLFSVKFAIKQEEPAKQPIKGNKPDSKPIAEPVYSPTYFVSPEELELQKALEEELQAPPPRKPVTHHFPDMKEEDYTKLLTNQVNKPEKPKSKPIKKKKNLLPSERPDFNPYAYAGECIRAIEHKEEMEAFKERYHIDYEEKEKEMHDN